MAMGLGSMRAVLEAPELIESFRVRPAAPDILLLANLGAANLNTGFGPEECQRAVDLVQADALILHLNPLQEALDQRINCRFSPLVCTRGGHSQL